MRNVLFAVMVVAYAAPLRAQSGTDGPTPEGLVVSGSRGSAAPAWQIGLLVGGAVPQADFRSNLSANAWLVGVDVLYALPHTPIWVGGALGGGDYGSQKRRVSLAPLIPESPSEFEVETTNAILLGNLILRVQPRGGRFRPYVEGVWGFSNFFTQTTVTDPSKSGFCWSDLLGTPIGSQSSCPSDEVSNTTNLDTFAPSYGVGVGAQIQIRRRRPSPGVRDVSLSLDMRTRWMRGGNAEYLKPGSIDNVDGAAVLHTLSSRTDIKTTEVGITVHF